ncbi:tripartite tricarboxylate transporter TctB family protein [Paraburkholderia caribensis]|uniref:tripartite tricarboxylate transporter TctB family protein n=1 Tax=Paraburkholderia caribensis TaxID=75105 RepID=UPI001CAE8DBE|nr:tripartite tricarboxylate transporter TctB family protein [Paraburkholderia caribensis]CAG9263036.1 Tripartite tricarboxylate transporter TctB family [Paraburkholderia caribensis]
MESNTSARPPSGSRRDYYGGALMVLIGLGAVFQGMSYDVGSLTQMGPGFFPVVLGGLLLLIGIAIGATAGRPAVRETLLDTPEQEVMRPDVRGGICIVASIIAFVVLGKWGGLVPASFAITFISALGDRENSWLGAFALSSLMTMLCVAIFWWALKLQFPLFTWG